MFKEILTILKSRRECTLDDLARGVSQSGVTSYQILDTVTTLVTWGLVDARRENRRLTPNQLQSFTRSDWPGDVRLSVSERLKELETIFGVAFDTAPFFGKPQRPFPGGADLFVVMPFAKRFDRVFERIKAVAKGLGLSVARADNFFTSTEIMKDIWSAINAASLIVADCTGGNPNVFYEIGIAHTIGKKTILIAQSLDDIPFDLRHVRYIIYRSDPAGIEKLGRDLETFMRETWRAEEL